MITPKRLFMLTWIISVLVGIILPLVIGVKDPLLIAYIFASVWFIYALIMLVIIFLVEGRRNLKKRLKEEITDKWGYS
jgi:hypothetical protein